MSSIRVKSSLALDTLCFLEKRLPSDTDGMNERQLEEIRSINALLPKDFGDEYIEMSNICPIVSACLADDPEDPALDDLIDLFRDPKRIEKTVKEKITGGVTASYLYPVLEWLKNGFADLYAERLTVLKRVGFESRYKERILPMVRAEIEKARCEVAAYDTGSLLRNISLLKKPSEIPSVSIYISFFSAPTAFCLYGGAFLPCFCSGGAMDLTSLIAHELMHGFASEKLTSLYLKHVAGDEKLRACHRALIEDRQSGDEEDFVLAAEYYLCYLSGNYSKEQLLERARKEYGGAESFGETAKTDEWQMTSNVCGLKESPLENITLRNISLHLEGGIKEYKWEVPEEAQNYPEVYVYGRTLPAKGIYFRHIRGLTVENVTVETYRQDSRAALVFDDVRYG